MLADLYRERLEFVVLVLRGLVPLSSHDQCLLAHTTLLDSAVHELMAAEKLAHCNCFRRWFSHDTPFHASVGSCVDCCVELLRLLGTLLILTLVSDSLKGQVTSYVVSCDPRCGQTEHQASSALNCRALLANQG